MSDSNGFLDERRHDHEFDVAATLKSAKETLGKSYFAVVREIFQLSRGIGKLEPQEYLFYRLYDEGLSAEQKAAFLGRQAMKELDVRFLKNAWTHVAADKLVLYALLTGLGLPVPRTFALYHPFRSFGDVACPRTAEALAAFLRSEAHYPFFSKPIDGVNSLGVAAVESYDQAGDRLVLKDGKEIEVEEFVAAIAPYAETGYCFQERLQPHGQLVELCGPRMSSFRVFLIVGDQGPEILRASWKIATGDHPADNFWRRGNLLAPIDVESGRVERVIQGAGPEQVELEAHPDTGQTLVGTTVPQWDAVKTTVLAGATALPSCKVQGWDVTVTEDGPVLIELEGDGGHPQMVQLPQGQGLYQGRFKAFYDAARAEAEAQEKAAKKSKKSKAA